MRVLLVDDHRVLLAGLKALLDGQAWVDEVTSATTVADALAIAREAVPDVAVVDVALGDESGLDLIEPLLALASPPRVLVLSMSASHDDARDAVRLGAAGYLLKDEGPDEVLAAIRMVAGGGTVFSAAASRAVAPPTRTARVRLSDRERELLALVSQGLTTQQIGGRLFLSPKTIRNRLSDLYRTLGVAKPTFSAAHTRSSERTVPSVTSISGVLRGMSHPNQVANCARHGLEIERGTWPAAKSSTLRTSTTSAPSVTAASIWAGESSSRGAGSGPITTGPVRFTSRSSRKYGG